MALAVRLLLNANDRVDRFGQSDGFETVGDPCGRPCDAATRATTWVALQGLDPF
jgi:hypothetical protein